MHQPRLTARVAAVLTCLVAAVGVSTAAAPAAPTAAAEVAGPASAPAGPAAAVTLITGDTATVTMDAAGLPRVSMAPTGEHPTSFTTLRRGTDLYVVPSSVEHLVPVTLDLELFNVTGLLAQGYGDAETDTLPVIVRGGGASMRAAGTDAVSLPSIGATAVRLPKKAGFATTLTRAAGDMKMWLDREVTAAKLDENLTRIGAPLAWGAGLSGAGVDVAVLDTGVDANHPDLRGQVVEQVNFTDDPTAEDGHGHGTHVASIIGGTGAAAGGARKGVAYGARLLSGKVLGADGRGQLSWLIEGMEWAAAQGADVVNISLGGQPGSEGDDPTARALDELSAKTGTLFVVAAGNDGPSSGTVGTPGVAASALTVGAANDEGLPPFFSAQGPTRGSWRAKPDITAPGVAITGALIGSDGYTQITGTSQATPHVAGAAALLRERHPDWDWQRIKNTLMMTADAKAPTPLPYSEGAGHLDLPGALSETLRVDRGNVDFGYLRHGDTKPRTITLRLSNDGVAPETVSLTDEVRDNAGAPAAEKLVTVSPTQVTVAPGSTVSVTVTLTPSASGKGVHAGAVTLTRQGKQPTRMPLGFYSEAPRQDITVTVLNRRGEPDAYGTVWLGNMARMHPETGGGLEILQLDEHGRGTVRMLPGPVTAIARVVTPASGDTPETVSFAGTPELTVDRDVSYTIDARKAKQLKPVTVEGIRTTVSTASIHYGRLDAVQDGGISDGIYATGEELARGTVFVQPTAPVRTGTAKFETRWELERGNDRYAVVAGAPTVPNPPAYRVRTSSLARVQADYRSLGQPDSYLTFREPVTDLIYATQGWVHPLAAPTKRTEWVTASPDVRWRQCVAGPQEGVAVLCQPTTTYRPGERRPAVWFRAPVPAVTTASHNRERIELPVELSDGEHDGSVRDVSAAGNETFRLYRNGVEQPRFGESWYFDTAPTPAVFRLEHTSKPDPVRLPIGSSTSTVWTFPSQAPTDPDAWDTKPRLLSVDYQPGADGMGRLPAWHLLDLGVRVTSMAGGDGFRLEPGSLRFWASADGGKRWHEGMVIPNRDGTYRVIVPGVLTRPGQTVSVRAEATAAEGRTIKQTVIDAYPVRR